MAGELGARLRAVAITETGLQADEKRAGAHVGMAIYMLRSKLEARREALTEAYALVTGNDCYEKHGSGNDMTPLTDILEALEQVRVVAEAQEVASRNWESARGAAKWPLMGVWTAALDKQESVTDEAAGKIADALVLFLKNTENATWLIDSLFTALRRKQTQSSELVSPDAERTQAVVDAIEPLLKPAADAWQAVTEFGARGTVAERRQLREHYKEVARLAGATIEAAIAEAVPPLVGHKVCTEIALRAHLRTDPART